MHFLTLTVAGWVDVFTKRKYRDFLIDCLKYRQEHSGLLIFAYVIMSNHLHLIVRAAGEVPLSKILADFKKFTGKQMLEFIRTYQREHRNDWIEYQFGWFGRNNKRRGQFQFWQESNHPIELFSPKVIMQKLNYIHRNPVVAGIVRRPEHYIYSSASNYVYGRGLLEVEIIEPFIEGGIAGDQ